MWRIGVATLVGVTLTGGLACNSLFGIHDLRNADAGGDACALCQCTMDSDCPGAHMVCDIQPTSQLCTCAAGYGSGLDGACAWMGVVDDPGFTTNTAWTPVGPAAIDTTDPGHLDPGVGNVVDASCANFGGFQQQVTMPRFSVAEPLVASVTYQQPMQSGPFTSEASAGFQLGGSWHDDAPPSTAYVTQRTCLGAAQYAPESTTGVGVPLAFETFISEQVCQSSASIQIDHAEITTADTGECPAFGTALDGDAESGGGWTFTSGANGSFAEIVAGAGNNGTHGVELFTADNCDLTTAATVLSPAAVASPVFSFWHSNAPAGLSATIDGKSLAITTGNSPTVDTYCLPPYLIGGTYTFRSTNEVELVGVACQSTQNVTVVLDDLTLSSDPACGSDPAIADPGFESGRNIVGAQAPGFYGGITIGINDMNAHSGARDLVMFNSGAVRRHDVRAGGGHAGSTGQRRPSAHVLLQGDAVPVDVRRRRARLQRQLHAHRRQHVAPGHGVPRPEVRGPGVADAGVRGGRRDDRRAVRQRDGRGGDVRG